MPPASSRGHACVLSLLGHPTLPFERLHGEPLHVHALRALDGLGEPAVVVRRDSMARARDDLLHAGLDVRLLGDDEWWGAVRAATSVLVHDALCPLTAPTFLAEVHARGSAVAGTSLVAYRPVTDTVKTAVDGRIEGTIDREALGMVASPYLLAGPALEADEPPPLHDPSGLVVWLRARGPVDLLPAPTMARRVDDASAVNLLECLDELARQVR